MTNGINLLPWRKELRRKNERYFRKQILIVVVITATILILWHLMLLRQINIAVKQADNARQMLLLTEKQSYDKNNNKQQKQQLSQIINLEQMRFGFVKIFESLHCGMASNAWLTKLIIKGGECTIFGKSDSMFGITKLIRSFAKVKYCTAPVAQKIKKEGDEYDFILSLSCKA